MSKLPLHKKILRIALPLIASVAVLALASKVVERFGQPAEAQPQDADAVDNRSIVETAAVTGWEGPFDIETDGEAVTYRIVTVGSEVQGRVTSKSERARSGTFVESGTELFRIDPTNYELEKKRLQAQEAQAKEDLEATKVELKSTRSLMALAEEDQQLQKNQLDRVRSLKQRNAANDLEVEQAAKRELDARNNLQSLNNQASQLTQQIKTRQAAINLVKAQLEKVDEDIRRCVIKSPLNGRIVDDLFEEGNYVKSGDELVHISDGSRMEIKAQLQADELAWVWQQHKTNSETIDPLNLPQVDCKVGYEFEGVTTYWNAQLARIEGTGIDRATRTFPCRVIVEKPRETFVESSEGGAATVTPPTLLSGMFVDIRIPVESPIPLVRVPLEAVRPGSRLWVVQDGVLRIKEVRLAHVSKTEALIRSGAGLEVGDRVVISPLASAIDGMKVKDKTLLPDIDPLPTTAESPDSSTN